MKLWIDDVRPAPVGYFWCCKSVNEAKKVIRYCEEEASRQFKNYGYVRETSVVELIDIDHDAGDYVSDGGDYIKLLDWLEETGRSYPIHIHSMNPVGVANMRAIIEKNGWKEIR